MSAPAGGPSRPLRALGAAALPRDAREGVLGDLEEVYRERRAKRGRVRAEAWYLGQVLALAARFAPDRLSGLVGGGLGLSWLDLKLGFRMLAKHPGLSLAGGAALAVTIAFGAGIYAFFSEFVGFELPFADGDRIVRITSWDTEQAAGEPRTSADFAVWREEVRSIAPLTALREVESNVSVAGGVPLPIMGVRTTASLFQVVRVPPALGRPLVADDEREGAPPVVVVSHAVWEEQLAGAPLDGLTVRLNGVEHAVVGVMPEGFRFPIDHQLWAPLHVPATGQEPRQGAPLLVFGMLAPGASLASAQAELTTLGRRAAERWPSTHARLEPRVTPFFAPPGGEWQRWVALGFQTAFGFLVALAALNVAILSFSRTASRQGEIAVRAALGAGRRRIVSQLFAEALVLSGLAAVAGLTLAAFVLPRASELFWSAQGTGVPYWVDPGLSPRTVAYALGLAVLGACVAGMVPALKVTGKGVGEGLRGVALGGSPLRFGAVPTLVIVVQVALAVAFLPYPAAQALAQLRQAPVADALAGDRILTALLEPGVSDAYLEPAVGDGSAAAADAEREEAARRFGERLVELEGRLRAERDVVGVAFGDRLPGMPHIPGRVRLDGAGAGEPLEVRTAHVVPGYVEALDIRLVAGRALGDADLDVAGPATVALVNEAFVRQARGGDGVGRRLRLLGPDDVAEGPWVEVVGVVEDLSVEPGGAELDARPSEGSPAVYLPAPPASLGWSRVAVRLAGPADAFAPAFRRAAAAVDPGIRVTQVVTLDALARDVQASQRLFLALSVLLALLVTGLAVGGVYTLMSFLVQQRTREIGIRTALGADRATLLRAIFARALVQLALGTAVGLGLLALFVGDAEASMLAVVAGSAGLVLAAGIAACVLPSRRALRIHPTEALRAD